MASTSAAAASSASMAPSKPIASSLLDRTTTFESMSLDKRILLAVAKKGYRRPTLVQSHAIPLAMRGRDILARARTGSGKTGAYCLPAIQKVLQLRETDKTSAVRVLMVVPSAELAQQVASYIESMTKYCSRLCRHFDLSGSTTFDQEKIRIDEKPDIIVGTPAKIVEHIRAGSLNLKSSLQMLIIDEADIVLSSGFEADVKTLAASIPRTCQNMLMSATLDDNIESLKKLILRNPAILKLEDAEETEEDKLVQYVIEYTKPEERFLQMYVALRFDVLGGQTIIFVNSINQGYRIKIFLEKFAMPSAVLNSALPVNSRNHIVSRFNQGDFRFLIATDEYAIGDESNDVKPEEEEVKEEEKAPAKSEKKKKVIDLNLDESIVEDEDEDEAEEEEEQEEEANDDEAGAEATGEEDDVQEVEMEDHKPQKFDEQKLAFGIARGIDFANVTGVINFDFPLSARAYMHRVGRTARAGNAGVALSFVHPEEHSKTYARIKKKQEAMGRNLDVLTFDTITVESLRYRVESQMAGIKTGVVKQVRAEEIRQEALNSEKLKKYFKHNPQELAALKHSSLQTQFFGKRSRAHNPDMVSAVPDYLKPQIILPSQLIPSAPATVDDALQRHKDRREMEKRKAQASVFDTKGKKKSKHAAPKKEEE